MAGSMNLQVVAADRLVWEGNATNLIVRTTEGDIGILPGHESMLAALVPCAAEIVTDDGRRETIAIEGGFLSVAQDQVSLVSPRAVPGREISADDAQRELDELQPIVDRGDATVEQTHRYHLATAQLKVAEKLRGHSSF